MIPHQCWPSSIPTNPRTREGSGSSSQTCPFSMTLTKKTSLGGSAHPLNYLEVWPHLDFFDVQGPEPECSIDFILWSFFLRSWLESQRVFPKRLNNYYWILISVFMWRVELTVGALAMRVNWLRPDLLTLVDLSTWHMRDDGNHPAHFPLNSSESNWGPWFDFLPLLTVLPVFPPLACFWNMLGWLVHCPIFKTSCVTLTENY